MDQIFEQMIKKYSTQTVSKKQIAMEDIKEMLRKRFVDIDYAQAKQDVVPFIKNSGAVDVWGAEFFCAITEDLKGVT